MSSSFDMAPAATSFALQPDYTALAVVVVVMVLTVVVACTALYLFHTRPWLTHKPPTQPPSYKQQALKEGLQLLSMADEKQKTAIIHTTQGIQPLSSEQSSAVDVLGQRRRSLAANTSASLALTPRQPAEDPLHSIRITSANPQHAITDGTVDIYLTELTTAHSTHSLDNFDLATATQLLSDTKSAVTAHCHSQAAHFQSFTTNTLQTLDHIKQLLAIKLTLHLNTHQHAMPDIVDRLISSELLSRQSHMDITRRTEQTIETRLEELIALIRNINDDYDIYPIQQTVQQLSADIDTVDAQWRHERHRRKYLASFLPIVGRRLVQTLGTLDAAEEAIVDGYLSGVLFFKASCVELMKRMLVEESNHASVCEKLDDSATMRREYEMDRYHLALMKLLRDLQTQLTYLNEKLVPLHPQLRRSEDDARATWIYCQSVVLEDRWAELEKEDTAGSLFKGVNSELAKVLTGLIRSNRMAGEVDVRDPFETVYDPGYREDEEEAEEEREEKRAIERERKREERQREREEREEERRNKRDESAKDKDDKRSGDEKAKKKHGKHKHKKDDTPAAPAHPSTLLAPLTSAYGPAVLSLVHDFVGSSVLESVGSDGGVVRRQAVEVELSCAMEQFGEDAVEMVSVWRVAREIEANTPQADTEEADRQRKRLEATERLRKDELEHTKQRMEEELQDMEAEMQRLAEADKQLLEGDLARLSAMIRAVSTTLLLPEGAEKSSSQAAESAVEQEIRVLLQQEAPDAAAEIAQLLNAKHRKAEEERRALLRSEHEAELAQLKADRANEQESDKWSENEQKQRASEVAANNAIESASPVATSEQPPLVRLRYTGDKGQPLQATVMQEDEQKVVTLDQQEAERQQARDAERAAELTVVQRREGEYATMPDDEYEQLIAALQQQHGDQRQREVEAARQRKERLLQQLEADCQRRLLHWEDEQRRLMGDEERSREDALLKLWVDRLQGKTNDPRLQAAVAALLQKRQRRELEDLMQRLAHDKAMAATKLLAERIATGDKDVSIAAVQAEIRQRQSQSDLARIAELEDTHTAQLAAAIQACCATTPIETRGLHYDAIEQRRQAIAEELRAQQSDRAATVAEERQRILADSSLSEDEKARRIAELLAGLGKFDDRQDWERRKQDAEMARKMDDRKRKKREDEERKAKEKADKEAEKAKKREEMQAALQEERKQHQEQLQQVQGAASLPQSNAATTAVSAAVGAVDPAMAERLQRIESALLAMQSASTAWRETAYIDPLDATDPRYLHDTQLLIVDDSDMQPSVRFLHRFAVSFLRLVHALPASSALSATLPPLTVQLASSLPPSVHPSCTYKNSFHYSAATRALYIRKERAEDVGAFLCVLVSAVAHVMAETEAREEVRKRKAKEDRARDRARQQQPQQPLEETKESESRAVVVSTEELAREEARQRWEAEQQREVDRTWDDRDPRFQRHLHRMHQCVMADYFYAASPPTASNTLRWPLTDTASQSTESEQQPATVAQAADEAAVSAVVELHPAAATSTTPTNSLLSSTLYSHLPNFSTSRLLTRLRQYSTFEQHSQLASYLRALEHSQSTKDRERWEQRLLGGGQWGGTRQREQLDEQDAGEVEDELNERLVEAVRLMYVTTAEYERDEADDKRRTEAGEAVDEKERDKRAAAMRDKRWRLHALSREREELMSRLRNLQEARGGNKTSAPQLSVDE